MSKNATVSVGIWLVLLALVASLTAAHAAEQGLTPPAGLAASEQPVSIPAFSLPDVQGTMVHAADLLGKVVVVRFWATW